MNISRTDPVSASWLRLLPLCAAVTLLVACGRPVDAPEDVIDAAARNDADAIVARIGGRVVTASQADATLQLALHDLAMQAYRLRRQALEAEVLRALQSEASARPAAEILLVPPAPPRLNVEADPARTRPGEDAPVTVVAFCNFESPHCARLQITLAQVLPLFPGVVRYAERDLPLAFHWHAGKAAEAAHCAAEQNGYWRLHDNLYATTGALDRAGLDRAARSSDLDMNRYADCLDGDRHAATVAADVALAKSLGLTVVPAVFVNGLYASPEVQPSDLIWLIERELAARGVASPRRVEARVASAVPVELRGLVASTQAGQGLAVLAPSNGPAQSRIFREGDAISSGLVLRRVTDVGIELMREGRPERVGWDTPARPAPPAASAPGNASVVTPHRAIPVTLDRDRVLVLLSDRIALAEALQPVPMTTDGYRQLRVQTVAPGSLYELLGFQPRDVILSVNEQPVHEASNPLWDALEKEGEVRVRVIRSGGLAKHFTYRFGD